MCFSPMAQAASHSQREWILIGAAECCAAQGYEATTVADICAAAGVSAEDFDQSFAGKAEAVGEAMDSFVREGLSRTSDATVADKAWPEALRDGTARLLALLAERPAFARLALVEAPVAGGRAAILHDSARAAMVDFIGMGCHRSASAVPGCAARGAFASAETLVAGKLLAGEAKRLPELAPDIVYVLAVPYLGRAEARRLADPPGGRGHLRAVA